MWGVKGVKTEGCDAPGGGGSERMQMLGEGTKERVGVHHFTTALPSWWCFLVFAFRQLASLANIEPRVWEDGSRVEVA